MVNARVIIGVMSVIAACGGGGEAQSFRAAVGLLCASDEEAGVANVNPAERRAAKQRWIDARLKHREVRDVFVRLPDLPPAERAAELSKLAARAGIATCRGGAPAVFAGVELAEVAGAGAEPADQQGGVTVVVNPGDISVEGKAVVPLIGGAVDPAELQQNDEREIPRLKQFLARTVEHELAVARQTGRPPAPPFLRIVMPRTATYALLIDIMMSAKRAGFVRFALVGRRGDELVEVPITLPMYDALPPENALQLVVAVTTDDVLLFSVSGLEGTIQEPKLRTAGTTPDDLARLQATLVDVAARHTDERTIIAMFDAATPVQSVLALLATVRARPDGRPLFPDVILSAGFR